MELKVSLKLAGYIIALLTRIYGVVSVVSELFS